MLWCECIDGRYICKVTTLPTNVIKEVQRFRVTCLLTGQYDTKEYGTIAGVI